MISHPRAVWEGKVALVSYMINTPSSTRTSVTLSVPREPMKNSTLSRTATPSTKHRAHTVPGGTSSSCPPGANISEVYIQSSGPGCERAIMALGGRGEGGSCLFVLTVSYVFISLRSTV